VIVHIVLFQPKHDITQAEREAFASTLQRTVHAIPEVQRARVGSGIQVGVGYEAKLGRPPYDFVALLEFATLQDLRTYLDHPLHEALGVMFWQTCESTMILDADVVDAADADLVEFLTGSPTER